MPRSFAFIIAVVTGVIVTFIVPASAQTARARKRTVNDGRIIALESRTERLEERVDGLEKEVDALRDRSRYRLGQFGIGPSMPFYGAPYADGFRLRIHGRLKYLEAFYYPGSGGGAAVELPIPLGPVTLRPVALGIMAYQNGCAAMSSRWLQRRFDLVVPIGADVRIWNGLTLGAQASWFFPSPLAAGQAAADAGTTTARDILEGRPSTGGVRGTCGGSSGSSASNGAAASTLPPAQVDLGRLNEIPHDARTIARRAYSDAWAAPRIELTLSWSF